MCVRTHEPKNVLDYACTESIVLCEICQGEGIWLGNSSACVGSEYCSLILGGLGFLDTVKNSQEQLNDSTWKSRSYYFQYANISPSYYSSLSQGQREMILQSESVHDMPLRLRQTNKETDRPNANSHLMQPTSKQKTFQIRIETVGQTRTRQRIMWRTSMSQATRQQIILWGHEQSHLALVSALLHLLSLPGSEPYYRNNLSLPADTLHWAPSSICYMGNVRFHFQFQVQLRLRPNQRFKCSFKTNFESVFHSRPPSYWRDSSKKDARQMVMMRPDRVLVPRAFANVSQ